MGGKLVQPEDYIHVIRCQRYIIPNYFEAGGGVIKPVTLDKNGKENWAKIEHFFAFTA